MTHSLHKIGFLAICSGIILICTIFTAESAEIRLKNTSVQIAQPLVTLADVADVMPMGSGENVEALRRLVLFPAPSSGTTRALAQWELRSILSQLGINPIHHLISGADSVTIVGATQSNATQSNTATTSLNEGFVIQANHLAPANTNSVAMNSVIAARAEPAPPIAGLTDDIARLLERQVAEALNVHLNFSNRIERVWDISLKLTPEQIKLFATNGQIVDITGGQIPFTGVQRFHIRMQNNVTITVDATVELPMQVVVATRALPKNYIINASDVMLQRADRVRGDNFFVDINSVVGKETTRAIRDLAPVTQSDIRKPLWVRRGEVVTVRAVHGGITVTTEATAMQDGVEGDTITVAKIDLSPRRGRQEPPTTYLARVSAPKTLEVFVR